jgi:N-acetylglucosamine kinase-like BadF-type ATPase
MGEHGGASSIVAQAVEAVAKQWTHPGPATSLTVLFLEAAGAGDVEGLLQGLALGRYQVDGSVAPRISRMADRAPGNLLRCSRHRPRR